MHIRFADSDENFIKNEVRNGFYTNETELVRDAVRKMREEKEKMQYLKDAVAKGITAIANGETIPLTPGLLQEIKQEVVYKSQHKKPYNSTDALL